MSTARYEIRVSDKARKEIERLPKQDQQRIEEAIQALADDPRPPGCLKMHGAESWRIRVGMYRVIYEIHDRTLIVLILRVAHRKDSYRP